MKTRILIILLISTFWACEQNDVREELALVDLNGNAHAVGQFGNDYLLVNFWATWCKPCIEEMPSLQKLQNEFGEDLTVILVSDEKLDKINAFREKYNVQLPMYQMAEATTKFQLQFLPTTMLISPNGDLLLLEEGERVWDAPDMQQQITDAMANH